jgi:drug/metabolite transporter (DMT)-like permease
MQTSIATAGTSSLTLQTYSFALVAPLLWAGNFAVGRVLNQTLPPLTLNCLRWLLALMVLLPLFGRSVWYARSELTKKWKTVGLLALTGVVGFNSVLYLGLRHTTALSASMIFSITPLVILLISSWIDRKSICLVQSVAVTISVGGALLVLGGNLSQFGSDVFLKGDIIILLACLIWASYCVLIKTCRFEANGGSVLLASVLIGLLLQIPLSVIELLSVGLPHIGLGSLLAVAYLGIGAAAVAFLIWQRAIQDWVLHAAGYF